jgi:hypothetical protein
MDTIKMKERLGFTPAVCLENWLKAAISGS